MAAMISIRSLKMQNELLLPEEVRLNCTALSPSGISGCAHKDQEVSGFPELAQQTVIFKMSVRRMALSLHIYIGR
jgi:hypothetical protein